MKSIDVKDIYDKNYFLKAVDGCDEFDAFDASYESLFYRYKLNINALDLKPTDRYLEIGCGRGEIVMFHSKLGGAALGIDFSKDAIDLAISKKTKLGLNCEFKVSSFTDISEDIKWEKILASEFIEHISKEEGQLFFEKAFRLLNNGGRLVVFTYPNTLERRFGYPLMRLYNLIVKQKYLPKIPADWLSEHMIKYHLNEQNIFTLRNSAINSGFKIQYSGYDNPGNYSLVWRMIDKTPLRHILRTNLLLVAEK